MCYKHIIGTKLRKISHKASLLPYFFAHACTIMVIRDRLHKGLFLSRNDKNRPFHRYFSFLHIGFKNVCRIFNSPLYHRDSFSFTHSTTIEPLFVCSRTLVRVSSSPYSIPLECLFVVLRTNICLRMDNPRRQMIKAKRKEDWGKIWYFAPFALSL